MLWLRHCLSSLAIAAVADVVGELLSLERVAVKYLKLIFSSSRIPFM